MRWWCKSLRGGVVLTSLAALVLVAAGGPPAPAGGTEIALQVVKMDGLQKALVAHKGRIVLVDVWSVT